MATTYNNMALVYDNKGEYDRALEYYEKCIDIQTAVLGEKHPDLARTFNNMAVVYNKKGEYNRALEHYGKCY